MLLAAVDLGSNSFRLEIGKVDGAHIARHGYWKETVRLAAGLDESNKLSKKSIDIAVETLARMNERLRGMKNEHVRAVGTQSLRQARNLDEFLLEAQHALGFPIEVISGREEARLVFEGCMHMLPPSTARRLVVDIGGASTEVIVGKGFAAENAESFKVGCVNTSLRFFKDGRIDRSSLKKAQVAAAAEIEDAVSAFSRGPWDEAYRIERHDPRGVRHLAHSRLDRRHHHAAGLAHIAVCVARCGRDQTHSAGRHEARSAGGVGGGVAVLSAVFDSLEIDEMRPARGALRVGVLYDLLGRRERKDLRDSTVVRVQSRFGVDRAQAQRVSALAPNSMRPSSRTASGEMANHTTVGRVAARGRVRYFPRRLSRALGVSDSA